MIDRKMLMRRTSGNRAARERQSWRRLDPVNIEPLQEHLPERTINLFEERGAPMIEADIDPPPQPCGRKSSAERYRRRRSLQARRPWSAPQGRARTVRPHWPQAQATAAGALPPAPAARYGPSRQVRAAGRESLTATPRFRSAPDQSRLQARRRANDGAAVRASHNPAPCRARHDCRPDLASAEDGPAGQGRSQR